MRGGRGMGMGRHAITPAQARQLLLLLGNRSGTRRCGVARRGGRKRRRGGRRARNQKGGFIGWLIKQFM